MSVSKPNCATQKHTRLKTNVQIITFLVGFALGSKSLSIKWQKRVTPAEIMLTAVETAPRIIKIEIIGVSALAPGPLLTNVNTGMDALAYAFVCTIANNPITEIKTIMLLTIIPVTATLIASVDLSIASACCEKTAGDAASWKEAYKIILQMARPMGKC